MRADGHCCYLLGPNKGLHPSLFLMTEIQLVSQSCVTRINSFCSLASSEAIVHIVRCSASSFNFRYPLVSVRSSSSCLRLLPRLSVSCFILFIYPSVACFRRHFLLKMWVVQSALLLCVGHSSPTWLCVILHFEHDRSKQSFPSVCSSAFVNFTGICDLRTEVSKFQLQSWICSKCSAELVCHLNALL
jgi:hypothetical protein